MAMIDPFVANGYSTLTLTDAFQVRPNQYQMVSNMGLFTPKSSPTRKVAIERNNGVLNLLPFGTRGAGPATAGVQSKRDLRDFLIPHIPHAEYIYADDVQDLRRFGSEMDLQTVDEMLNEKFDTAIQKFDATLEHMLCGALRGVCIDGYGNTAFNWFTEFGVTEQVFNFQFSSNTFDVSRQIVAMKRYIETNLFGETMSSIMVLCSPEWMDNLIAHPSIKEAYDRFESRQVPLREDVRVGFEHKGVLFVEYVAQGSQLNLDNTTTVRRYIAQNEARAFPLGTTNTFRLYYGPPDYLSEVNKPGLARYAKMIPALDDRFITLDMQTNPLAICMRPQLLVRLTQS